MSGDTKGQAYFLNHPRIPTAKEITKTIARSMDKAWGMTFPVPDFVFTATAPLAELQYPFFHTRPKLTRDKAREVTQRFWLAVRSSWPSMP